MESDRAALIGQASVFFERTGSAWMYLTPDAAAEVCAKAAVHDLVVVRIEGGLWSAGKFEARLDGIWDGMDPPVTVEAAHANNLNAVGEIANERSRHNAFVVTAAPITGYTHDNARHST